MTIAARSATALGEAEALASCLNDLAVVHKLLKVDDVAGKCLLRALDLVETRGLECDAGEALIDSSRDLPTIMKLNTELAQLRHEEGGRSTQGSGGQSTADNDGRSLDRTVDRTTRPCSTRERCARLVRVAFRPAARLELHTLLLSAITP